jgi:hypothetical protein
LITAIPDWFEPAAEILAFAAPAGAPRATDSDGGIFGGGRVPKVSSQPDLFGDVGGGGSLPAFSSAGAIKSFQAFRLQPQDALAAAGPGGGRIATPLTSWSATPPAEFPTTLAFAAEKYARWATTIDASPASKAPDPFSRYTPKEGADSAAVAYHVDEYRNHSERTNSIHNELKAAQTLVNPEPTSFALWAVAGALAFWKLRRGKDRESR